MTNDEQIEEFLGRPWHLMQVGPEGSQARTAVKVVLTRAAEAGKLGEILDLDPPVSFQLHIGQRGWTAVLRDLPQSMRFVHLAPEAGTRYEVIAGVVAHELGHAFHGHKGHGDFVQECEADDKACDWGCRHFLEMSLEHDIAVAQLSEKTRAELVARRQRLAPSRLPDSPA